MEHEVSKSEGGNHTGIKGVGSRGIVEFEEPEACEDRDGVGYELDGSSGNGDCDHCVGKVLFF